MADLAYGEVYAMNPVKARKRLVQTYQETGSIRKTASLWGTSRRIVRKWVRRAEEEGEEGLRDRSRRPRHSPRRTDPETEALVVQARRETGYGRLRLSWYLKQRHGLELSPYTIRHILRRHGLTRQKRRRKPLYPAHWAWSVQEPFSLLQTDLKDILDKAALGKARWDHIRKHRLPRYQWTACESRSRLRLLAYSHRKTQTNGITFLALTLLWFRLHDVATPITFQTDWGQEFGGDDPEHIQTLEQRFLRPLNGALRRYPKGRKQYNGRVERSHRSDDEEFYRPYILKLQNTAQMLKTACRWIYFFNVIRPHFGYDMEQQPPLAVLRKLGYTGPDQIALFPPILLDNISTDFFLSCDPKGGTDLLAHYTATTGF